MPNEQENIDEQIIRDWVEMKKLQHPGYWTQMKDKLQIAIRRKHKITNSKICCHIHVTCFSMRTLSLAG